MASQSRKYPGSDKSTSQTVLKERNRRLSLVLLPFSAMSAILTCLAYLVSRAVFAWKAKSNGGIVVWMVLLVEGLISGTPCVTNVLKFS